MFAALLNGAATSQNKKQAWVASAFRFGFSMLSFLTRWYAPTWQVKNRCY
jgi:hypothetical protein